MINKLFGLTPNTCRALYFVPITQIHPVSQDPEFKKGPQIISTESFTTKPPRYFARGGLDKDRKKSPTPLFHLLTESDEKPKIRPIPWNRELLRTYGRGKGTLKRTPLNHTYLDVDNQFILSLASYLRLQGLARPPYFNLFSAPEGAHITVIPTREHFFHNLSPLPEEGQEFSFELEGLYSLTNPTSWPEVEEVWFFKAHSIELEQLRRRHFLPPHPGGHSFMIAIAVKPAKNPQSQVISQRISPSVSVA